MCLRSRTAAILACNEGGIGVEAIGLRLARSPATVLVGAVELRVLGGRATAASGGEDESAMSYGHQKEGEA